MLRLNRMTRRNRKTSSRRNRNRKQNGGACALAGAPYGADLMADSRAQSLAQGNQFANITRPYHGGYARRANRRSMRRRRVMYGGMAPLSIFGSEGTGVDRASAHLTGQDNALAEAAGYSRTHPDLPDAMGAQVLDAVNKGMAQVGGRRRRSRKGSRKSRKNRNRKNRNSRRNRRMNGGRRSSCGMMQRGGAALLEGSAYSQNGSNMLLADDSALQAQAAKMESPAWTGVARGTYLG